MSDTKPATRNLSNPVPLKLTPALETKVAEAVEATGLKKSDVLRMSVERGLDVLLAQLTSDPKATHAA
ncbi:hypothetical protein OKA05_08980 [Luteolibacter arcticus]|uniref:Ribbon-helix-helix protein CopG domain-containing protein n=1 Tax=Luteolibacter arcticus TaxID=1581411 RepID=A0ABT3GH92_9BACT|nr:hypothetical protein [Luteolibacter arcticus]MCW1922685.1 hypothetical protein [Luteolibacter arcticus]